jgi:hypothetical protein
MELLVRRNEFFEFKVGRLNHFGAHIAEQIRVLAIVESEAHFLQICREMFRINFMPRSDSSALQETERRFHGVRANVSMRVLPGVLDAN